MTNVQQVSLPIVSHDFWRQVSAALLDPDRKSPRKSKPNDHSDPPVFARNR